MKRITKNDWNEIEKIAKEAMAEIPYRFCRKREEEYYYRIYKELKSDRYPDYDEEIKLGDCLVYTYQENLGTKKWPHYILAVEYDRVRKVRPYDFYMECGRRPDMRRILAIMDFSQG